MLHVLLIDGVKRIRWIKRLHEKSGVAGERSFDLKKSHNDRSLARGPEGEPEGVFSAGKRKSARKLTINRLQPKGNWKERRGEGWAKPGL